MTAIPMDFVPRFFATAEHISSHELNMLIDSDMGEVSKSDELDDASRHFDTIWGYKFDSIRNSFLKDDPSDTDDELDPIEEGLAIMVDPRTGAPVKYDNNHTELWKQYLSLPVEEPKEPPVPYHWRQDHDYVKCFKEEEEDIDESDMKLSAMAIVKDIFKKEDEPVVEVWKIDNFNEEEVPVANPVPKKSLAYDDRFKRETRRTSTRTADLKRKEQARKISNAVNAVFKNNKARRARQYKSIKPKNSVETTPSQSDIEEWSSQPSRSTYNKTTKKKTSKGRIDHSESERHRREVLRRNFAWLCSLIPQEYLRGEKVTSQISKQKILNGAKAFITALYKAKSSYSSFYRQNDLLKERWIKSFTKAIKFIKKQK